MCGACTLTSRLGLRAPASPAATTACEQVHADWSAKRKLLPVLAWQQLTLKGRQQVQVGHDVRWTVRSGCCSVTAAHQVQLATRRLTRERLRQLVGSAAARGGAAASRAIMILRRLHLGDASDLARSEKRAASCGSDSQRLLPQLPSVRRKPAWIPRRSAPACRVHLVTW